MNVIQNVVNKKVPNAPNTSSISKILLKEIFLQDMSCKSRHNKVQLFFLKKELSSKGQVKENKGVKHPRFSLGFNSAP
jgi:ribosomal protein S8